MTTDPIYADDLELGTTFHTDGVTVTESHVVTFAGLSGDMNPLHLDAHWAETEGPFPARIAHGLLTLSLAGGFRCMLDDLALVAFLGIDDWRFRAPVYLGDTVHARMTLADLVPTSTAARSVLRVEVEVHNQQCEIVQQGTWAMMIMHRKEES